MPRHKTLEETYDSCLTDGYIKNLAEMNVAKARALMENAQTNVNSAKILATALEKNAKEWLNVYTLHYEALRVYAEALLLLLKIDSPNHQCLFAALCMKYPHLELDWNFFEKIRTKRNGANYYGEQITWKDWKDVELQMNLYISTVQKELEAKLESYS